VSRHQGLETAARKQVVRDAIRLVGGLNEKFPHSAHIVPMRVISLRAHQFCCVKHVWPQSASFAAIKKPACRKHWQRARTPAMTSALAADELLAPTRSDGLRAITAHHPKNPACYVPRYCHQCVTAGARFGFLWRVHQKI